MTEERKQSPYEKVMSRNKINDPRDFFPTPERTARAIFEVETFDNNLWEPAAGTGIIARIADEYGYEVYATDLYKYDPVEYHPIYSGANFFQEGSLLPGLYDIVTNPPYSVHMRWIEHSLDLAKNKVALLFPSMYLQPKNKRHFYTEICGCKFYMMGWRSKFIMPGRTKSSGMKDYTWVVWDKSKPASKIIETQFIEKSDVPETSLR